MEIPATETNVQAEIKPISSYKRFYDSNEEYRKKHSTYMCTKVTCACGREIYRSNATNHRQSKLHKFLMDLKSSLQK